MRHIVVFQGLRDIGTTPWLEILTILAVTEKLREAQKILDEEGVKVEGHPLKLLDYCQGRIPSLSRHSLTAYEHPMIYVASIALWEAEKPPCDTVMGFSCGEWTAAVAAGCMTFREGLLTMAERGRLTSQAGGSSLLVRGRLPIKRLRARCKLVGDVWLANINSATQGVVSGKPESVARIATWLEKDHPELKVSPIDIGGAFHTPRMEKAKRSLGRFVAQRPFRNPRVPVICNATGNPEKDPEVIQGLFLRQMSARLNFLRTIRRLTLNAQFWEISLPPGRNTVTNLIKSELQRLPAKGRIQTVPSFGR